MSKYTYPTELKKLKVCVTCNLMKTNTQFLKEGCNNCKISKEAMADNITSKFKGMIAITDPRKSWCAKYLDKNTFVPGFYGLGVYDERANDNNDYEEDE